MAIVFVVQAQHPTVPGRLLEVHTTKASALGAALIALNIVREDEGLPTLASLADVAALEAGLDEIGVARNEKKEDREFDVWIEERELIGAPAMVAIVAELGDMETEAQRKCPSHHWNNGEDVCEDCGKDLG